MTALLVITILIVAILATVFFATLSYALRDVSRAKLTEYLELHDKSRYLGPTMEHRNDLVLITATLRQLANILIFLSVLDMFSGVNHSLRWQYFFATLVALLITLTFSVAIPNAAARYAGESIIGAFAGFLHAMRVALLPITKLMHAIDHLVRQATGGDSEPEAGEIEQEILSVVEEGQKEGVVDVEEREMIESVIEFRATQVGQIMSARPEIVALDVHSSLAEVKETLEESGYSRIPVYDGTLDHVVGILYARDLLKHLGLPPEVFDIRSAIRPAIYVPESKPLRDLLNDFRAQKVHIGTAGLVTIEDILEEIVGDISDEHEPAEPAMLRKIDEHSFDVDARMYIDELNRQVGLSVPEDQGYDTLGGFVSTTIGRIPPVGASFEHGNAKYTVINAEPQKINRVKIDLLIEAERSSSV
jgi:putative hemolysin